MWSICELEREAIFVKSEYLGVKERRIIPALPSGMDIPPPKRPTMNIEGHQGEIMFQRNKKGIELEKAGNIDEAIKYYEANVRDKFDGNHPYDNLAYIYRERNFDRPGYIFY